MADEPENDDQWLYGDQPDLQKDGPQNAPESTEEETPASKENEPEPTDQPPRETEPVQEADEGPPGEDSEAPDIEKEPGEENNGLEPQNGDEAEVDEDADLDDDDDDSDDNVNVVIGDIKSAAPYTSLNIKRGGLLTTAQAGDKSKLGGGKFTVEEFDQAGMINGVPAIEYNLDSLEDKPWRKPGADITDYFNYGFNEETWRAYCERQKRMRMTESGAGLQVQMTPLVRGSVIMNDNSKYGMAANNFNAMRQAGPPPGRRMTGAIDVIGGVPGPRMPPPQMTKMEPPKMNVIQVMTADRREYSRKPPAFPDMSMPPPTNFENFQPEFGFNPEPEPFYGGYEPTQDSQWGVDGSGGPGPGPGGDRNWQPEIKSLTPGPTPIAPPPAAIHMVAPPMNLPAPPMPVVEPRRESPPPRAESREREKTREPSRARSERPKDKDRERSHRRDRSRSRSRRHKSKSRSPSHRHKKKKSRRHEESD